MYLIKKMCECLGCESGQDCYRDSLDNEDKKFLWEGIDNSIGGIEKWIEEKKLSTECEFCERTGGLKYCEFMSWLDAMDECEGGIKGVYFREMQRKEKKLNIGRCKFFTISPSGTNQKDITEKS